MKISDKELDDLFSQKLNDLEVEPNAAVWENITAKLDGKSTKKSLIPALRIAAGVIVVLSIGLLFLRKDNQPVKNHPQKVVKQKVEQVHPQIKQNEVYVEKKNMPLLSAKNKVVKEASALKRNKVKASVLKPALNIKDEADNSSTQTVAQNPSKADEQNAVNSNPTIARIAVVPDASVSLKASTEEQLPAMPIVKPMVLADVTNHKPTKARRKGIRNMGDLVNLVMAKVDKRTDKLIEFSDSDDGDESNVTGINLGIISIKKEK